MASIQIEGDPAHEIPRDAYDLRRRGIPEPKAVCHAPFSSLHVAGSLHPCRYSTLDLGDPRRTSVSEGFAGAAADGMRERFRQYVVRRSECGHCVHHWEDEAFVESPAQAEYDRALPPVNGVPPKLVALSVDTRVKLSEARLGEIRSLAPGLQQVELVVGELAGNAAAQTLLATLSSLRPDGRPKVRLIVHGAVPAPDAIAPCVTGVELTLPLRAGGLSAAQGDQLAELVDELRDRSVPLVVRTEIGRSNWADLKGWWTGVLACGAATRPTLLPRDHADTLAALEPDVIAAVHGVFYRWSQELGVEGDEARGAAASRALLLRLRHWQRAGGASAATPAPWTAPPLDHALLADETEARHLLQDFLRIYHEPRVERWLAQLAHHPGFVRAARERCSLRLVGLWLGSVFERSDVRPALRAIYESRTSAAELVAADRAALAGSPIAAWHEDWVRALKLELAPRGGAPFEIPPATRARGARPQVTVVIPSFNHERYVGQAIDSVLAQGGVPLRVLVVDDRSRDGTLDAARSRQDPRVVVRSNARNLGLGESLFQALEGVRTPYVSILNSDDFFHPRRLERCVAALARRPGAAVAATRVTPVDAEGCTLTTADASPVFDGKRVHDWLVWYEKHCRDVRPRGELLGPLLERNFLVTSSNLVCRRDWLLEHAAQWRDLEYCVDWQIFLQAALEGALQFVPEPLLGYRLHASNTVWFDQEREWRYYVESHRVIARALEALLARERGDPGRKFRLILEAVADSLGGNTDVDWAGVYLGLLLERLGLPSRSLRGETTKDWIRTLDVMRRMRVHVKDVVHLLGDNLAEFQRMRAERPFLLDARNQAEAVTDELARLRSELTGSLHDRANLERLWHQAERERDCEVAGKDELHQKIGRLEGEVETERNAAQQRSAELEVQLKFVAEQRDQLREHLAHQIESLRSEHENVRGDLQGALTAVQQEHENVRNELERALSSLHSGQDKAQGELLDALQSVQLGHELVRGELLSALQHLQAERTQVERTLTASLTESAQRHAALLDHAARERESLQVALDDLHGQAAALHVELDRARRALLEERAAAKTRLDAEQARLQGMLHEERMRLGELLEQARAEGERLRALESAAAAERTAAADARAADLDARLRRLEIEAAEQKQLAHQRTRERDEVRRTPEFRFGSLVLNKLKLKRPLRAVEKQLHKAKVVLATAKLRRERRGWFGLAGGRRDGRDGHPPRVFATVCWNFPIYSQTFVYQELLQLEKRGFDLRLIYSKLDPKDHLHPQFASLWDKKRPMYLDRIVHERDFMLYKARCPDRVERITQKLCEASGLARAALERHDNFLQGFTYARLAEAWGAEYLHSYFFYDRSLMSLIAGEVLDLPHGVSCYADHLLKDYELKVVPLHMELCDVVIATSARIKRELLAAAPATPAGKILVKPNAIDCTRFPVLPRPEPGEGQPFRLVVTSRIEPKKGLVYLVEAVQLLLAAGVHVECHLVGDADHGVPASENYKAELCELISRHGLWGRIHLEGRQPEQGVRRFLAQAHLFVAPFVETDSGDKDGIPTALVEAMATGIPSVVTDAGSITEVVDDGADARVVPQRDPRALAAAIGALLADPAARKFMGWKAAQKAREKFDVSVCEPLFHDRVRATLAARKK